jgi:hypothetical protein
MTLPTVGSTPLATSNYTSPGDSADTARASSSDSFAALLNGSEAAQGPQEQNGPLSASYAAFFSTTPSPDGPQGSQSYNELLNGSDTPDLPTISNSLDEFLNGSDTEGLPTISNSFDALLNGNDISDLDTISESYEALLGL